MELRKYQAEAVAAVERELAARRSTLISLATGTGKTIVFSEVVRREVRRGGRALILAHRGELLDQARDKLYRATGITAGVERADETSETWLDIPFPAVVGSVQSMCRPARLARFDPGDFTLIVIDECHHALAETYRSVLAHFPSAKVLGVTATPDRGDMRGLSEVFETVAYEYGIRDAVRDGFLSPIRAQMVPLRLDLSSVDQANGDFSARQSGAAIDPYLGQIAAEMAARCAGRKTVAFTPLVATSEKLVERLRAAGIDAREVDGMSRDRAETLAWFDAAPPGCCIVNSMLLTEGWDSPTADCVCVLRPTRVRALYCQMVGRGTRLAPGKKDLLLLDFLWLTGRLDLCRPASLVTGSADVAAAMGERLARDGEMGLGEGELAAAEQTAVAKREEALAKQLEANRRKAGRLVDPLQYAFSVSSPALTGYEPRDARDAGAPTASQTEELERRGVGCPGTYGEADALIGELRRRSDEGMATPKQIRFLERKGFRRVGGWAFDAARSMIDRIAANGWRVPRGVSPKTYRPVK